MPSASNLSTSRLRNASQDRSRRPGIRSGLARILGFGSGQPDDADALATDLDDRTEGSIKPASMRILAEVDIRAD